MSETDNGPELFELGRDHRELQGGMLQLSTDLARMEGKIDTQTALLNGVTERQNRSDSRVDDLETVMRKENRRLEDKHNTLASKVWMACGAISLIALFPALIKIIAIAKV